MGSEQLEDSEFEPMFNSCESDLGGKKLRSSAPTDGATANG